MGPTMNEIEQLYKKCGVNKSTKEPRKQINCGNLNNQLNTNFHNIYGKCGVNTINEFTVQKL